MKVELFLHVKPEGFVLSEELTGTNGVFSGDGPLSLLEFGQVRRGNACRCCNLGLLNAEIGQGFRERFCESIWNGCVHGAQW